MKSRISTLIIFSTLAFACSLGPDIQIPTHGIIDPGLPFSPADVDSGDFAEHYALEWETTGGQLTLHFNPLTDRPGYHIQLLDMPAPLEANNETETEWTGQTSISEQPASITATTKLVANRWIETTIDIHIDADEGSLTRVDAADIALIVSGAPMPYRFCAANDGPYGPTPPEDHDGEWHARHYPFNGYAPSTAAYNRQHGILVTAIDGHVLTGERSYFFGYQFSEGEEVPLIGIRQHAYHPDSDVFGDFVVPAGEHLQFRYVGLLFVL